MVFSGPGHRSVGSTVGARVPPRVSGIDGSGGTREVHRDAPRRRVHHRPRAPGGLARILRAHLLPARVRRARPEDHHRAGQRRPQPRQGHPARDALPVPAQAGDQAGAGHQGRRRRHHRRPAPREPDVPRARQRRADRGQRPSDLRPGALRPRVPDAGRRHRHQLPGRRVLRARDRGRSALRRPAPRAHLAAAGGDDVRQGPGLDPARRVRARAGPEDGAVILVDTALRERETEGRPVRVGMLGAGFMGQGLTNQIENSVPGMRVAAIHNRKPQRAVDVYAYSGHEGVRTTASQREFDDLTERGIPVVAEDPYLMCRSPHIDILVDVTGSVEFGAHVILEAFRHGKSVVLMNAEVDATIGPILRVHAKKYGQILSACDGDEPGLQMNLVRWVTGLGLTPRVVCNIKGLQDPHRNPTTQQAWAERWEQNPAMVTSFADGSKISFEQAIVANATGFSVLQRGMSRGLEYRGDVMEIGSLYDVDKLRELGGVVDYVVGTPLTKVYCLAEHTDPKQQHYLELYKMGTGPLYSFFIPYHLVHFEVPFAIARAVLFRDSVAKPLAGPVVEVCAVAKRDLKAGEVLDDYGC